MAKENIVVGLDVGTQFVRAVVGQRDEQAPDPSVLGIGVAPSSGLRRGIVVDVEETVKAVTAAIEEAERVSGVSVGNAFVNISGNHIESQNSRGVVAVSRADSEIGAEDVARAIEAAKAVAVPANKEIIHVLPREYVVDGQEGIKDPIGMNGIRLEVEAHVISAASPQIKNITKCVYQSGVEVDDLVLSGLAASRGVLSRRQKELGVAELDIGAGVTDLTMYEEGDVLHTAVIGVGGSHLTNDLAIGLRTDTDIAERVKLEYGSAQSAGVTGKETIDLGSLSSGDGHTIERKLVAEVIEARVAEILALVKKELKRIDRDGKLPAGVVLTGGTAKLPGLVEAAKQTLGLPAQVGFPSELQGMADKVDDPSFATSLGLMLWGFDTARASRTSNRFGNLPGSRYLDKVRGVVKQFLP